MKDKFDLYGSIKVKLVRFAVLGIFSVNDAVI